jgi:hypothetical protein
MCCVSVSVRVLCWHSVRTAQHADDDAELDDYELRDELFLDAVRRRVALLRAGDNGAIPARDNRT